MSNTCENNVYREPKKGISNIQDMPRWLNSQAYAEYLGFIMTLNKAVEGKSINSQYPQSAGIAALLNILTEINSYIDKFPPIQQPQRFGNAAFRSFYNHLKDTSVNLLRRELPERFHNAIEELSPYLVEGFGNATRIDYGTGHEISFLFFVSCLFKIGFLELEDKCAAVLKVFDRYMELVRRLQTTYRMEPAGSHGSWSLDDFQFVPFIWGSSQLIGHDRIEPKSYLDPNIVEAHAKNYLFLACIDYINRVKSGPFFEHSYQLYNISGVATWNKLNQGLIKMYEKEVLNKFPVIQHVLFGSLMSLEPVPK